MFLSNKFSLRKSYVQIHRRTPRDIIPFCSSLIFYIKFETSVVCLLEHIVFNL